ncbi:ceruloplasmin-like [Hyperolius riggenbachi]|uniref:ceruloplasmin-like n=1 Tax=Hyperolius riggenbachi TaxID=752182 RepID=UPI0035A3C072
MWLSALCLLSLLNLGYGVGKERVYYFCIEEILWSYAPTGMNVISGNPTADDESASTYLRQDTNRIGSTYKKVVYTQYTNASYTEEMKKAAWQGFLGPIMRAEIGDNITVHLKNNASRPYSLHPHRVRYTKENEGAFYPDNTSGDQKKDDYVKPGESYTYRWQVVEDQGPTPKDDDCTIGIYHSHVNSGREIYSGLVGAMILCKEGTLQDAKNEEEEFVMMFSVMDENMSWFIDENINTFCMDPASVDKEDPEFQESNLKHSINGYMFGNLPGLSVCDNTKVKWYMFSLGTDVDIHSVHFHGQTVTYHHNRVDTISLLAASMVQATMVTTTPGTWLLACQVNDHFEAGMQALYEVRNCSGAKPCPQTFNVRQYYIAAVETMWNYAPTSINQITGKRLDEPGSDSEPFFTQNGTRIGGTYKKVVYREFTDSTFTKEKPRPREQEHLGILGPLIMAQIGDTVKITFKNMASHPYSIQAHGVNYQMDMGGAFYKTDNESEGSTTNGNSSQASHVAPNDTVTYLWGLPDSVSPIRGEDPNCIPWLYYSSTDVARDTNSGLVGPLLVCKSLTENNQGGADHNYFMMPTVFDENLSWYMNESIAQYIGNPDTVDLNDPDFQISNLMSSINGYMYGNQPGLSMCVGDSTSWHMLGLGTEVDAHGIHFTGNTVQIHKTTRDVASLSPYISYSALMTPDNAGIFNVECLSAEHFRGGMRQHYRVSPCGKQDTTEFQYARTVVYYIAAEEIEWDYSENRTWEHQWHPDNYESPGDVYLNKTRTSIGSKYKKVVYQAYTDCTFKTRKERTEKEQHLGLLGPFIFANVGDKIKVLFLNKANRTYSIYAHGLLPADNETKPAEPGQTQTYVWYVSKRSGPNVNEDCLTWAYYSDVNQVKDINSGLVGPIVICRESYFPQQASIAPVTRYALLFMILNENESWYLEENIQRYSMYPVEVDKRDPDFYTSNLMSSINGKMYANLQGLTMYVGDFIAWHIFAFGSQFDIHTVHFHAHSLIYKEGHVYQTDVFDFFPGSFQTVSMIARSPGTWLLHCHVNLHMEAGMITMYQVMEKKNSYN